MGEPAQKKGKIVFFTEKVMVTVFRDNGEIILIDYLAKDKTVNKQYYAKFLDQSKAEIKKKRPHFAKKKFYSGRWWARNSF